MSPDLAMTEISNMMNDYSARYNRSPRQDMAIWDSLDMYYSDPEAYELVATSTKAEAFNRMLKDRWFVKHDYYGLDYEVIDEVVLEYLTSNALVQHVGEEN
jgi:hypothetical protein